MMARTQTVTGINIGAAKSDIRVIDPLPRPFFHPGLECLVCKATIYGASRGTATQAKTMPTRPIKRQNMGREVGVAVKEGRLDFGTWEQVFYGEFDGWRRKRALVKVIGE